MSMRRSLPLLLLLVALCASAVSAAPKPSKPIQKLKVIVRTADDFGASTDSSVWFSLGPSYEWTLDTPGKRPFKNGASDVFTLPAQGLRVEDIKWLRLRKSSGDDWLLQGIEVWIDGKPYYRNEDINLWMEGDKNEWTAPNVPPSGR
jgi:hypothetical protein